MGVWEYENEMWKCENVIWKCENDKLTSVNRQPLANAKEMENKRNG